MGRCRSVALGWGSRTGDVDQVTVRVPVRGRAQQVVRDGRADRPGGIGCEPSRRNVGQGSVDEIGEGGDPDMTISLRYIVELARRFITASGRSESAMAVSPVRGDSVPRPPHPGENTQPDEDNSPHAHR
jgi:hypothetical protein